MEGHVRKRGNKWYYSFEASNVEGKRKRIERVGGRTKKETEAKLRNAIEEYNNAGLHFQPSQMSVSDYLDYWMDNYVKINCKHNTQQAYGRIIKNHIKPLLGIYKLKSLTPAILQEFVNTKFTNGISKTFLNSIIATLNCALKYAVHPCGFIKTNPTPQIIHPKYEQEQQKSKTKIISDKDFSKLLEYFSFGTSFHVPIMIGYHTGCRISEAMGLTWDDIDLDNRTIEINKILSNVDKKWCFGTPKTLSSNRTIKIGKTLVDLLKKHKKWQIENKLKYGQYYYKHYESIEKINGIKTRQILTSQFPLEIKQLDMVCTRENGNFVTDRSFKYVTRVARKKLNINFNFHSLRHTHATKLIENDANIKAVQTRLGHSNSKTTIDTYTHATDKMAEQSVEIFENCLRGQTNVGKS